MKRVHNVFNNLFGAVQFEIPNLIEPQLKWIGISEYHPVVVVVSLIIQPCVTHVSEVDGHRS